MLGARGKIGTFVETKNAQIGPGAKVPHLTYVGRRRDRRRARTSAPGTIFANYDGVDQVPRPRSGAYSFVGSDSVLAAPVAIADGAYIAAGSTITGDVGAGELAVSRGAPTQCRRLGGPETGGDEAAGGQGRRGATPER